MCMLCVYARERVCAPTSFVGVGTHTNGELALEFGSEQGNAEAQLLYWPTHVC